MNSVYKKANILYLPALIMLLWFIIYPFMDGLRISFTNWNGFSQNYRYIGFGNFLRIVEDSNFLGSLINTLIYGFGSTFLQQLLGLSAALLLNRAFKGRDAVRTIVYLPAMISGVIMGFMWRYLTEYSGALNDIAALFGREPVLWLSSTQVTVPLMVIINSFQYYGISMIIYLAGLQGIPRIYYEAARIEGAGNRGVFLKITLPLLYPSFMTSVMINLIGGLKLFDVIKALTGGGPGYTTHSLATFIHVTYFASQNAGYAAAIGFSLFVLILGITLIVQGVFKRNEVEYL
ncbi:MAG: sugar ABC transporter permease [Treponema sp.]|jgi:raffinose/stachyose/melibiose transport system permease protein|nr:sugar ABC transporter permease [Treponema sp.]